MLNMCEKDLGKLIYKYIASHQARWHSRVNGVRGEEHTFFLDRLLNRDLVNDIFLGSVFYTDKSKPQWYFLVHNHTLSVGSSIHNIDFSDNTDGSNTLRVQLLSHLKTIRCSHISVCRNHNKDNSSWVRHVSIAHGTSDLLDVFRLVWFSQTDLCDTWEIDKGKIRTCVGVHIEDDRFINNTSVWTSNLIGQLKDLVFNLVHVKEFLAWDLFGEDSPRFCHFMQMSESQLKRSTGTKSFITRKEIEANNGFKYRGFTGTLTT